MKIRLIPSEDGTMTVWTVKTRAKEAKGAFQPGVSQGSLESAVAKEIARMRGEDAVASQAGR